MTADTTAPSYAALVRIVDRCAAAGADRWQVLDNLVEAGVDVHVRLPPNSYGTHYSRTTEDPFMPGEVAVSVDPETLLDLGGVCTLHRRYVGEMARLRRDIEVTSLVAPWGEVVDVDEGGPVTVTLESLLVDEEVVQQEEEGRADAVPQPCSSPDDGSNETSRWGTVLEAAAILGVSRDTIDRMRRKQRKHGWTLPGEPVGIGLGNKRRREKWDLDRVPEWAAAFEAKQREKPHRKSAAARQSRARCGTEVRSTGRGGPSLYARATMKVNGPEPKS